MFIKFFLKEKAQTAKLVLAITEAMRQNPTFALGSLYKAEYKK